MLSELLTLQLVIGGDRQIEDELIVNSPEKVALQSCLSITSYDNVSVWLFHKPVEQRKVNKIVRYRRDV